MQGISLVLAERAYYVDDYNTVWFHLKQLQTKHSTAELPEVDIWDRAHEMIVFLVKFAAEIPMNIVEILHRNKV
jgi:hypothetical protein